jgi:hypothetical protein
MNCTECEHHKVEADPDPYDWFCDDDVYVVCALVINENRDEKSIYHYRRDRNGSITCACRPYNISKECDTPDWCPLNKGK